MLEAFVFLVTLLNCSAEGSNWWHFAAETSDYIGPEPGKSAQYAYGVEATARLIDQKSRVELLHLRLRPRRLGCG